MAFKIVVVYFSRRGRLATLAHVIAEGARKVAGAEVSVWRINDPVFGDDADKFDEGLLEAPIATKEALLEADGIILGAPGRQAGMCGEMRLFLDSLADMQTTRVAGGRLDPLRGKVGGAFTAVGGHSRGFGGHEAILQAFHATFLQHGMLVAGVPPSPLMDSSPLASTFGTVMGGPGGDSQALDQYEVRLAYSQGEWIAQIAKQLHDRDL